MVEAGLDPEELDAIRGALSQANGAPRSDRHLDAAPVALIADDRAGERARPEALRFMRRWVPVLTKRFRQSLGIALEAQVTGVDIVEGSIFREQFARCWTRGLEFEGRSGVCAISIGGALIEGIAVRLLGAPEEEIPEDRAPSSTVLRVFSAAGEAIVQTLQEAWKEDQGTDVEVMGTGERYDSCKKSIFKSNVLLSSNIEVMAPAQGQIKLLAAPGAMIAPPTVEELEPPNADDLDAALSGVPIQLSVDLGHTKMSLSQFSDLKPGMLIPLEQTIDAPLPIRCAGIVKAVGFPLINKGSIAIEVANGPEGN